MKKTKYVGIFLSFILTFAFTYQGQISYNKANVPADKPLIVRSTIKPLTLPDINRETSDVLQPEEPLHTEPEDNTVRPAQVILREKQLASRNGQGSVSRPLAPPPDRVKDKPVTAVDSPPTDTHVPEPQPVPEPPQAPSSSVSDTNLNSYVLNIISSYQGSYPYLLNNDYANYNGVTENLFFGGRLLAKAHPSGNRASHCSGITFEVFFKAMQARNRKLGLDPDNFNGMTFTELSDFLQIWYVASGNKRLNNIEVAVEKYGIGKRISNFEDAKRGDFVDFSRSNGTGHTVVLLNWVRDNSGKIIGLHYWSSQSSTNGISEKTEYFDLSGRGNIISNQIYIARILPVHQYKFFR